MLTFIHGDDVTNSRNNVLLLLSGKDYLIVDGKKGTEDQLNTAFTSSGLFSDSKVIFIDGISKMKPTLNKRCFEYLAEFQNDPGFEMYVWDDKTIDKRKLSKFAKSKNLVFSLPKHYFTFLDSLAPQSGNRLHSLLFQLYPSYAPEQLLYAITNRTRQILMLKQKDPDSFEEVRKMAPFQRSKIQSQAKSWTEHDIIVFYKKLFETEVSMKTSALSLPLINHIDFLLISHLN